MKVAIHTIAKNSGHSQRGIGYYIENLLKAFSNLPNLEIELFDNLSQVKNVDLIHYPTFDLFKRTLPVKQIYPVVVTIHDLIPIVFPEHYPPGLRGKLNFYFQKKSLKNAQQLITDSEASKKDIVRLLNVSPSQVNTVYLAAPEDFKVIKDKSALKEARAKYKLPDQFACFVGSVNWNKNLLTIAQACLAAEIDLVLIGRDFQKEHDLNHPELALYRSFLEKYSHNPKIHRLGFVEELDLVKITNLADIQIFPSYYEGFGLPILQAQACGTPVITSQISSMPEVMGSGGLLVNPYKPDEVKEAILKIINDPLLRQRLIKNGQENVRQFSWLKTAEETVKVYEKALK